MRSQLLRLLIFHQRCEPLLELLNGHFLAVPMLHGPINRLRWDEHIIHQVNDTVRRNSIFDCDSGEGIDLDVDVTTIAGDINTERLVLKKGFEVNLGIMLVVGDVTGRKRGLRGKDPWGYHCCPRRCQRIQTCSKHQSTVSD